MELTKVTSIARYEQQNQFQVIIELKLGGNRWIMNLSVNSKNLLSISVRNTRYTSWYRATKFGAVTKQRERKGLRNHHAPALWGGLKGPNFLESQWTFTYRLTQGYEICMATNTLEQITHETPPKLMGRGHRSPNLGRAHTYAKRYDRAIKFCAAKN